MFYSHHTPNAKRKTLRAALSSGRLLTFPGAFNALSARMIENAGFDGVYFSGHGIAADLGLPDIGLTTSTEVADRSHSLARIIDIPTIADADTGFGEPLSVVRTIQSFEDAGLAGCHIEDQQNPKKCGHMDGVSVVDLDVARRRIRAAVRARRDPDFVIVARTDVRAVAGVEEVITRAHAFVDDGADVIFVEALRSEHEYATVRAAIDVPIMVNLNEFGKQSPLTRGELENLGINVAVYPVTLLRVAMGAVDRALGELRVKGHQHDLMAKMQSADQLRALLDYSAYAALDAELFAGS
jgi:methylisocitrate lyase